MIENFNTQYMTDAERRASLFRAQHTQPFFQLMTFPVGGGAVKEPVYKDKVDVNKDFWLTEIIGDFDEAKDITGTDWNISVYATLNQGSVYKYQQVTQLPSGFIASEARNATVGFATQQFSDKQFEYCPYLIRSGDRVLAQIKNTGVKGNPTDIHLMLKGYYTYPNHYLSPNATRGINESLAKPVRFETWTLNGDEDGTGIIDHLHKKIYSFKNDRFARVILGFGIVDLSTSANQTTPATIDILDTFRNLKWNNVPFPIGFLGPRMGNAATEVRDVNKYYLPIEYFWEPFSALQMNIDNTLDRTKYKVIMLTRTV